MNLRVPFFYNRTFMQRYTSRNPTLPTLLLCRLFSNVSGGTSTDKLTFAALPIVETHLQNLLGRHAELTGAYTNSDGTGAELSSADMMKIGRELAKIDPIVQLQAERQEKITESSDLRDIISETSNSLVSAEDREIHDMATLELRECSLTIANLEEKLIKHLIPKDVADDCSVVIEVRAGTGGAEAALFSAEVFEMYQKYAQKNSWQFEILSQTSAEAGGLKEASAAISGGSSIDFELGPVFSQLKHENGVHRVQRIPVTESQGRVHTSAVTVIVLPQPEEVDFELRMSDVRIETMRSQGAGGQHVNIYSAVRLTHIPTGVVASCQNERSQARNKDIAFKVLRARLFELERDKQETIAREKRGQVVGSHSGERSERIRTYHRVGLSKFGISSVMDGSTLGDFIEAMQAEERKIRLEDMIRESISSE